MRLWVGGLLVALLLATFPSIAQAAFSASSAASVSMGTYAIPAPASVAVSYSCTTGSNITVTASVSSYGKVGRATAYRFTLKSADGTSTSKTTSASTLGLTKTLTSNGQSTLTVDALVGTWVGVPLSRTHTC
ncbi:MAG TPA: hypothetical protein VIG41_02625 [Micrococcaceae bacterium]|jgi:hypothetical protein